MEVTDNTRIVAVLGLFMITLLEVFQFMILLRPRSEQSLTPPEVYDLGWAYADTLWSLPLQIGGSVGMLLGRKWGFLLALVASTFYVYSSIFIFVWDRDLGLREKTFVYWVIVWGMWPAYGLLEGLYAFVRLMQEEPGYTTLA